MMRKTPFMDRRALFSSGAAAALLAATGVSAETKPQRGGRFRMALSGASRSDNWVSGSGLFMRVARLGLVFDALTEIGPDGTLRGELATAWRSSSDACEWVFDLRSKVTFHDGSPFSAPDVVATLAPRFADRGDVFALSVDQIGIRLRRPDASLPFTLSLTDHIIRPAHAQRDDIGTGLYRVRRFMPGRQVLADRISGHYKDGAAGWFDEVELVSVPASPVRAQALAEYMVDAIDLESSESLRRYDDIALLPSIHAATHAVTRAISMPARTGRNDPLDDLRAAERWWFA